MLYYLKTEKVSLTSLAVKLSSPLVGSSRNRTLGLLTSAKPTLTLLDCPPGEQISAYDLEHTDQPVTKKRSVHDDDAHFGDHRHVLSTCVLLKLLPRGETLYHIFNNL